MNAHSLTKNSGSTDLHKAILAAIALLSAMLLSSGCSALRHTPTSASLSADDVSSMSVSDCSKARRVIVRAARSRRGCPYKSAGKGPYSFDCSGLTSYAYNAVGITLKPTAAQQYTQGRQIGKRKPLKKGDLVFFGGSTKAGSVSHVGIVVSYRQSDKSFTFVHAANSGVELQKSTNSYYRKRYLGARRILPH